MARKIVKNSKMETRPAEESRGKTPPSAGEILEKVRMLLDKTGYKTMPMVPEEHEDYSPAYTKPLKYTSPIEFTVNGIGVWLKGNILMIDNKPAKNVPNVWNIKMVYDGIVRELKNRNKPVEKKPKLIDVSRYLSVCIA